LSDGFTLSDFYCFDIETTGIDVCSDQAIEIAVTRFSRGDVADSIRSLVKPTCAVDERAYMVHGIGMAELENQPLIADVSREIDRFMSEDIPLVTYNGSTFDVPMWRNNCKAAGLTGSRIFGRKHVDVFRWVKWNFSSTRYKSLVKMAELFNIDVDRNSAHGALYDCQLTGRLLMKMQESSHISAASQDEFYARQRSIAEWIRKDEAAYCGYMHTDPATGNVLVSMGKNTGKRPEELNAGSLIWMKENAKEKGMDCGNLSQYINSIIRGKKK